MAAGSPSRVDHWAGVNRSRRSSLPKNAPEGANQPGCDVQPGCPTCPLAKPEGHLGREAPANPLVVRRLGGTGRQDLAVARAGDRQLDRERGPLALDRVDGQTSRRGGRGSSGRSAAPGRCRRSRPAWRWRRGRTGSPSPARSSAGMPMPSSTTSRSALPPSCVTRSSTTPPCLENLTALVTRFDTARISWLRSPSTTTGAADCRVRTVMSRAAAVSRMSPATSGGDAAQVHRLDGELGLLGAARARAGW